MMCLFIVFECASSSICPICGPKQSQNIISHAIIWPMVFHKASIFWSYSDKLSVFFLIHNCFHNQSCRVSFICFLFSMSDINMFCSCPLVVLAMVHQSGKLPTMYRTADVLAAPTHRQKSRWRAVPHRRAVPLPWRKRYRHHHHTAWRKRYRRPHQPQSRSLIQIRFTTISWRAWNSQS